MGFHTRDDIMAHTKAFMQDPSSTAMLAMLTVTHLGLSKHQGAPIWAPSSKVLIIRTPTKGTPNF